MVQILSGFRESVFRDSWTLVTMFSKHRTPKCQNLMVLRSVATFPLRWMILILLRNLISPVFTFVLSVPKKTPMASRSSPPVTPDPTVGVISWFHISGYGVQSPLIVQLPILDFVIASYRWCTIFLDPTVQIESWFCDSRIITVVFSDLYSLRVSEMPRSLHVSTLMDGLNDVFETSTSPHLCIC